MSFEEKILSIVCDLSQNSGGGISGNNFTDIKTETLNMKTASASTPTTTISIDDNMDVMFKKSNDSSPVNIIAKNVKEDNETRLAATEAKVKGLEDHETRLSAVEAKVEELEDNEGSGGTGTGVKIYDNVELSNNKKAFVICEYTGALQPTDVQLLITRNMFTSYINITLYNNDSSIVALVQHLVVDGMAKQEELYLAKFTTSDSKTFIGIWLDSAETTFKITALTPVVGSIKAYNTVTTLLTIPSSVVTDLSKGVKIGDASAA